jgi:hypothetical protein
VAGAWTPALAATLSFLAIENVRSVFDRIQNAGKRET